jgi:hypothetical protein
MYYKQLFKQIDCILCYFSPKITQKFVQICMDTSNFDSYMFQ